MEPVDALIADAREKADNVVLACEKEDEGKLR